jgi:serine/threonine-protein kinase
MTTSAPSLPPIIGSRYLPIRLIAKGGMGAVYEVEHARTGEHLALKVLLSTVGSSTEDLERFKREARASARIKSEHVVRVTDADVAPELDGAPFLVMELLEGRDLEREAETAPPTPATVVEWLRQVARALDKAHRLGIVHRDLKPENLFLAKAEDRAPIVKILDFGIVRMTEDGPGATGSGQLLGTPMYMAPEQVMTPRRITPATDRYSLGLVAYRLLTGESYYRGDVLNILAQLLHAQVEPPAQRHPGLGSAFDAWFLKACHRDPDLRFASAAEQIEQLSAAMGLPTIAFQEAHQPIPENRSPRSHRRIVALVLVAGGAVALGGVLLGRRLKSPRAGATLTTSAPHESVAPAPARAPALTSPMPSRPPPAQAPPLGSPRAAASSGGALGRPRAPPRLAPDARSARAVPAAETPKAADPYADQK